MASAPKKRAILVSQEELCQVWATSPRVVRDLEAAGMPGVAGTGRGRRFDLVQCIPWIKARWREQLIASEPQDRLRTVKAQIAELDLRQRTAELIEAREHTQIVDRLCSGFRSALGRLPSEMAARLVGRNHREIRDALREWSKRMSDAAFGGPS